MKIICNKAKNKTCPSPCDPHGKPHDEREDLYGVYCTLWGECILDGKEYKVRCVKAEVEMKDKIKDILNTYDKAFVPDKILDLPVKGLKVTRGYNQNENAFEVGLVYERPLTVGEALEMIPDMAATLDDFNYGEYNENNATIIGALTTKDGGRIVMEEK